MTSGKGKTALITSATSGIGREVACIHAEHGGGLVLVSKNKTALDQLKEELKEKYDIPIYVIAKDLCDASAPKEIFEEVKKSGLTIDYIINDAGFGELCKSYGHEEKHFLAMLDLVMVSLASLTRLFLPEFTKKNEGRILNISSANMFVPCSMEAMYLASKTFFSNFGTAFSSELSDTNVTITNLMPLKKNSRYETVFGSVKVPLFIRRMNSHKVAKTGYKAMLQGKLNVLCGVTFAQKAMYSTIPSIQKKAIVKSIRKMQEIF
ncbi:short-chain dehydrogenase of unknown substrate specificity [Sphaerochaeta pleomorpha str. Grapes]|uniref:Short-chain dehydrogenase n=1 Tax=Sphaerochaeta pleomorpha (strain ATCC BAA-1885 / DSM 22778 / Grapes) TaxID=158190 RepID=G8QVL3_SPHPG|nr:SDR family NAD(P)-dependent oxidoreductase [Sphaerochaeta pleomorpha]AEV28246.1 short-chain dehydrogenase of unknown substrate specificity [Sphaerochaeta pleomorpha str. Grapes]